MLAFLLLFHFFSCKKNIETNNHITPSFSITGKVIDSLGLGLRNIKVYYTTDSFVVTDMLGNWHINSLFDSVVITPKDSSYSFLPATCVVKADTNLVFTSQPITLQSIHAHQIYNWFAAMQLSNGLLESAENSNTVSLYDNALAALVFTAKNDFTRAELVFNYFNSKINSELLAGNGGFYQFRDKNGVPSGNRWLGDNAWLLIAVNNYQAKTHNTQYQALSTALTNWILQQQDTDGGIWGGFDNNNNRIGKVTEGMIDAFNAVSGYSLFHQNLLTYLKNNRWNSNEKLLMAWPGNTYVYALDNFAWGYCAFEDMPYSTLQKAAIFTNTQYATATHQNISGFCFDIDKDDVWLEGTGQMIVALKKAGQTSIANNYLTEIEKLLVSGNLFVNTLGIPYASNVATHYGTSALWTGSDTQPCISSGAWYLFGYLNFDPMDIGYHKNIPQSQKFWLY